MKTGLLAAVIAVGVISTAAAAERSIDKEVVIAAGVDQAWDAWTTREGIVGFFAPEARVEARPGGVFAIHFDPTAPDGLKGADDMNFLALQPKKMLSFTWNAPPHLPEVRGQRTAVTVRFKDAGDGATEVRLAHAGWGEGGQWDKAYEYFDGAWGRVLANLAKRFAEGPTDWGPFLLQLKAWQEAEDAKAADAKKP